MTDVDGIDSLQKKQIIRCAQNDSTIPDMKCFKDRASSANRLAQSALTG